MRNRIDLTFRDGVVARFDDVATIEFKDGRTVVTLFNGRGTSFATAEIRCIEQKEDNPK